MTMTEEIKDELLTLEQFAPYVGEDFVLPGDDDHPSILFKLIEATPLKHGYPGQKRPPFALAFRVASQAIYAQAIYRLTHPEAGTHDFFLVPSGQNDNGTEYYSTFN